MLDLDLAAANTADNMVMIVARNLISQVAVARMGRVNQPVVGEKIQRAIDRRLRQAWQVASRLLMDFTRGKVCPGMMENMQDRHPLRGHSVSAGAELRSIFGSAGHRTTLIASFCNRHLISMPARWNSYLLIENCTFPAFDRAFFAGKALAGYRNV